VPSVTPGSGRYLSAIRSKAVAESSGMPTVMDPG
jgi:hypothetical protein